MNIGSSKLSANHNIMQIVDVLSGEWEKYDKLQKLLEEIMSYGPTKTIIFTDTKRCADDITRQLRRSGWPTVSIHGDKKQEEREWVLNEFRTGNSPIMIATDVASRGIDISDIKFVVNYDYPSSAEDYIHRIGRTARANGTGTSYTFFTQSNAKNASKLIEILREANQNVPAELEAMGNKWGESGRGGYNDRKRFGNSRRDDFSNKRSRPNDYGGGAPAAYGASNGGSSAPSNGYY